MKHFYFTNRAALALASFRPDLALAQTAMAEFRAGSLTARSNQG